MSIFDLVVGGILIWGIIKGFRNGFIIELSSLVALVIGIIAAMYLSEFVSTFMSHWWNFKYTGAIAFLVIFVAIVIGMHFLAVGLTKVVELTALNLVNRIVGALFSAFIFAFIISVFLSVFSFFTWDEKYISNEDRAKSKLFEPASKLAPSIFPYLQFELRGGDKEDEQEDQNEEETV